MQKAEAELAFWQTRLDPQGKLANDHYEYFYTAHFGLEKDFYRGKRILDIGCGPRGSLEWAGEAGLRIGADPLAEAYRQLGTSRHSMQYVACGAENLPFPAASFDIVCAFNSLDHVDNLDSTLREIKRLVTPQGLFLLLTDVHRNPTVLEPAAFDWGIIDRFKPVFEVWEQRRIEYTAFSMEGFGDIYRSLRQGVPYDHEDKRDRTGILSAILRKK